MKSALTWTRAAARRIVAAVAGIGDNHATRPQLAGEGPGIEISSYADCTRMVGRSPIGEWVVRKFPPGADGRRQARRFALDVADAWGLAIVEEWADGANSPTYLQAWIARELQIGEAQS